MAQTAPRWLRELPAFVQDLGANADITIGAALDGGSEALVAHATTADGGDAIVKIGVPGPTGFGQEVQTLVLANGRGYVKLLRHDAARRVMLPRNDSARNSHILNLPIRDQIEAICTTMQRAWIDVPDELRLVTGSEKARSLADLMSSLANMDTSSASARHRMRTWLRRRANGEPHRQDREFRTRSWRRAQSEHAVGRRRGLTAISRPLVVDPDGMRAEPALDLAIPMRSWSEELLAGDAAALAHARCALISSMTGIAAEPIWQWGFMERMSTGLYLMQLGSRDEGLRHVAGGGRADRVAQLAGHRPDSVLLVTCRSGSTNPT